MFDVMWRPPQPGPWHRIPLPSSGLVCIKGRAGGVVIVLLMYVVIAALSTVAMAALAGGPALAAAAQPPWPVANATRPDTNSRDMTDTAA